jgi:hypothetical protein
MFTDIDVWSACAEHLTEEAFGWPAVESLPESTIGDGRGGRTGRNLEVFEKRGNDYLK